MAESPWNRIVESGSGSSWRRTVWRFQARQNNSLTLSALRTFSPHFVFYWEFWRFPCDSSWIQAPPHRWRSTFPRSRRSNIWLWRLHRRSEATLWPPDQTARSGTCQRAPPRWPRPEYSHPIGSRFGWVTIRMKTFSQTRKNQKNSVSGDTAASSLTSSSSSSSRSTAPTQQSSYWIIRKGSDGVFVSLRRAESAGCSGRVCTDWRYLQTSWFRWGQLAPPGGHTLWAGVCGAEQQQQQQQHNETQETDSKRSLTVSSISWSKHLSPLQTLTAVTWRLTGKTHKTAPCVNLEHELPTQRHKNINMAAKASGHVAPNWDLPASFYKMVTAPFCELWTETYVCTLMTHINIAVHDKIKIKIIIWWVEKVSTQHVVNILRRTIYHRTYTYNEIINTKVPNIDV